MKELSPRQLIFIREYIAGKTAAEAARLAGYSEDSKAGSRLMDHPLIAAEIAKATEKIREETKYNGVEAMAELDKSIVFARETKNATAVMRGVELKMKLSGLLIERIDQRQAGGFQIQIVGIDAPKEKLINCEGE